MKKLESIASRKVRGVHPTTHMLTQDGQERFFKNKQRIH